LLAGAGPVTRGGPPAGAPSRRPGLRPHRPRDLPCGVRARERRRHHRAEWAPGPGRPANRVPAGHRGGGGSRRCGGAPPRTAGSPGCRRPARQRPVRLARRRGDRTGPGAVPVRPH